MMAPQKQWQDFLSSYTLNANESAENSLVNLPDTGFLCVEGIDAKKFLQGQLTCNLDKISTTEPCMGAHCNPQGRVISLFHVFYLQERYYLQMPREMVSIALAAFKKYAVFFKVVLSDVSDQWISIGYIGNPPHDITFSDNLMILKLDGYLQITGSFTALSSLWKTLIHSNTYTSTENWKHLNFKAHIPTIYPETSEKLLPHEINLPELDAISFDKGCYTGQEIIARMHYRGKAKSQLMYATVTTEITPVRGTDIYDDQKNVAGIIVDYYKTSYNTYALQIVAAQTDSLFLDQNKHYPVTLIR